MSEFESHRPEESWEWEDVRLNTLDYAPGPLLEDLAEHHIDTVGALLGATRGLLDTIRVGEEYEAAAVKLAENLAGVVPNATQIHRGFPGSQCGIPRT